MASDWNLCITYLTDIAGGLREASLTHAVSGIRSAVFWIKPQVMSMDALLP